MKLSQRLVIFLKTLNPDSYPKLCEEFEVADAAKQFLFTFILLSVVMLLLFIPAVLIGAPRLQQAMASFDSFSLGGNFSASVPVVLLRAPLVVVDLRENATLTDQTLLFTKSDIQWRRWYLFGRDSVSWDEVRNAKAYSENAYTAVFLFLIPSLAFWLGLFLLLKDLLLILLFGLLAFLVPRLWRFRISPGDSLKVSFFASSIMLFVEMILFPFVRIPWLSPLLFLIFLAVGIALVGDRDLSERQRRKKPHSEKHEPWE
jgi:hypothetical protein